jgi:hypothetical protein
MKSLRKTNVKPKGAINMKMIIESQDQEGLDLFLGETVTLFCQIYIYTGKLIGVNETFVKLEGAKIVYETGSFADKEWKDAQALPGAWYIQKNSIESFGKLK